MDGSCHTKLATIDGFFQLLLDSKNARYSYEMHAPLSAEDQSFLVESMAMHSMHSSLERLRYILNQIGG